MRVIVCGSGVIGVASAYYLARLGHEVVVVDRQPRPGMETSFANAGQVSWSYATPWAAPGIPFKAMKWMLSAHSPLVIRPRLDPVQWSWMLAMLRNCTRSRYAVNKERMVRLAAFSHVCIQEIRKETGIRYDEGTRGTMQVFRTREAMDGAADDVAVLKRMGVPHRLVDRDECLAIEPGLARVRDKIAGGLHMPGDETGDCFKFTTELAQRARAAGVQFLTDTLITGIRVDGDRILGVDTEAGYLQGDAYLLAMGSHTPRLLRTIGVRIPVYPVKGYSATVPVTNPDAAPVSTIMDEAHKVAVTRLGDRIRAAGTAELAGYDTSLVVSRCRTIRHVVEGLFPDACNADDMEYWTGLRSMTPDGPPILGRARYRNLFLNTGHGTLGWTMACGSGRVVADLIAGREPPIDIGGLTIERYAA